MADINTCNLVRLYEEFMKSLEDGILDGEDMSEHMARMEEEVLEILRKL